MPFYQGCLASSTGAGRATVEECPSTRAVWLPPREQGGQPQSIYPPCLASSMGQGGPLPKSALLAGLFGLLHGGREGSLKGAVCPPASGLLNGGREATVQECPCTRAVWPPPRGPGGQPERGHLPPRVWPAQQGQGGPLSKSALLPGLFGLLHRGRDGSLKGAIYPPRLASSPRAGRATVEECPSTRAVWPPPRGAGGAA